MVDKIKDILKQQKRNIIFYFDENGSFKEELKAIEDAGIKVIEVSNKNSCMSRLLEIATDENKLDRTIKNLKELELDEIVLMWFNNLLDTLKIKKYKEQANLILSELKESNDYLAKRLEIKIVEY